VGVAGVAVGIIVGVAVGDDAWLKGVVGFPPGVVAAAVGAGVCVDVAVADGVFVGGTQPKLIGCVFSAVASTGPPVTGMLPRRVTWHAPLAFT
jgi:hypothetical protein